MSEEKVCECRYCGRHGLHPDWRYQESKNFYYCRKCIREDRRTKRIETNYKKILAVSGKIVADRYLEECRHSGWVYVTRFLKKDRRIDGVLDQG